MIEVQFTPYLFEKTFMFFENNGVNFTEYLTKPDFNNWFARLLTSEFKCIYVQNSKFIKTLLFETIDDMVYFKLTIL